MKYVIFFMTNDDEYIDDKVFLFKNSEDCMRKVNELINENEYNIEVCKLEFLLENKKH